MAPRTAIEAFDVIEDDRLRGTTAEGNDCVKAGLRLEGAPEGFRHRVFVAVAAAAHAAVQPGDLQGLQVCGAGVLDPLVRVVQHARGRRALLDCLAQGRQRQTCVQGWAAVPADHLATPTVKDHGQLQEPLFLGHVGDFRHPDLVWPGWFRPLE